MAGKPNENVFLAKNGNRFDGVEGNRLNSFVRTMVAKALLM